jgi:hypothetical protein
MMARTQQHLDAWQISQLAQREFVSADTDKDGECNGCCSTATRALGRWGRASGLMPSGAVAGVLSIDEFVEAGKHQPHRVRYFRSLDRLCQLC